MKINISQTKKELGAQQAFSFVTSAEELDINEQQLVINDSIAVQGKVVHNGRLLEVDGDIQFTAMCQCDRCLDEFVATYNIPFAEKYQENEEEKQDTTDSDVTYFHGDILDITNVIRENVLLAQPIQSVCSDTCLGLCGKCGVNLNRVSCSCDRQSIDPRLAGLQKLLDKE